MNTQKFLGYICVAQLLVLSTYATIDRFGQSRDKNVIHFQVIDKQTSNDTVEPEVNETELACLQQNVYFEARNQSKKGMQAVAEVTINRVSNKNYPDSICDVVFQGRKDSNGNYKRHKCQFSWVCDGKSDTPNLNNVIERDAWETARNVALTVYTGNTETIVGNSTHYHATSVNPFWARSKKFEQIGKVDSHIFYQKR